MGVAKSDFSQMCRNRPDLIENTERFAPIDLDLSDFEKNTTNASDNRANNFVFSREGQVPPAVNVCRRPQSGSIFSTF